MIETKEYAHDLSLPASGKWVALAAMALLALRFTAFPAFKRSLIKIRVNRHPPANTKV
ncbi:hypothetical protein NKI79_01785 [Mesorhizobium sp. M0340]|uniref:hypothetical protein n=1 Tax=Mesorhizobium sp. M0340 TaxID=2956939 RepID=UPI00333DBBE4